MTDSDMGYDEFSMLKLYADHEGIPWQGQPEVVRRTFVLSDGQRMSSLIWGQGEPEFIFLHGRGQNAHTWDSMALAMGRPLMAIDLLGHGHSDWRTDHDYGPERNAKAIAGVLHQVTPSVKALVGMSLGGLTAIHLVAQHPQLASRLVVVDITPGSMTGYKPLTQRQRGAAALIDGPATFESFEEMLQATASAVPGRPVESLRPGVLHNSRKLADGRWSWRYDNAPRQNPGGSREVLWDDLSAINVPIMVVRGGRSAQIQDEDLAEVLRRQPEARIEVVEDAGHSVQSDQPLRLTALIDSFIAEPS